ncbi:hypothetical protein [Dietzia timorensis]|uniref:Uncharacterized protein n=1 Tax=Dietzia timorensis TaxID=499555 RepID=A0A173LQK1_9ACTN|nr:hypothetical protein [Dietzia timorensis]ANI93999.1 Hypothetical protein BJL86_3240 [Dietzia timorensis]
MASPEQTQAVLDPAIEKISESLDMLSAAEGDTFMASETEGGMTECMLTDATVDVDAIKQGKRYEAGSTTVLTPSSGNFEELIATFRSSAEEQNFGSYELAENEAGWKEHSVSDADGNRIILTVAESVVEGQPLSAMLGGESRCISDSGEG